MMEKLTNSDSPTTTPIPKGAGLVVAFVAAVGIGFTTLGGGGFIYSCNKNNSKPSDFIVPSIHVGTGALFLAPLAVAGLGVRRERIDKLKENPPEPKI